MTSEKELLEFEYEKTNRMIQKYNSGITDLKSEIKAMKNTISNNSINVHSFLG